MPWKKMSCERAKERLHELKGLYHTLEGDIEAYIGGMENESVILNQKYGLEMVSKELYDGLSSPELSIKKAKEVLGEENVFGVDAYRQAFHEELDLEKIGRVPFTVAELIRAKEKGMKLIARYEVGRSNAMPSVAAASINGKGIMIDNIFWMDVTKPVKNEWVLVSDEQQEKLALYKHVNKSWGNALEILLGQIDIDANNEIAQWAELIHQRVKDGDVASAAAMLSDLVANKSSHGQDYLVSASEELYDWLIRSRGDFNKIRNSLDEVVTGSLRKDTVNNFEPQFVVLNFDSNTKHISTTTHHIGMVMANTMRYQVRV